MGGWREREREREREKGRKSGGGGGGGGKWPAIGGNRRRTDCAEVNQQRTARHDAVEPGNLVDGGNERDGVELQLRHRVTQKGRRHLFQQERHHTLSIASVSAHRTG